MTSYPMLGPGIHNKSGSKPLMQDPLPFFPAQRPFLTPPSLSLPYHMAWPINKQAGKETTSLSPLKEQRKLS